MFCRKCGGQMSDNAKWCQFCGQKEDIVDRPQAYVQPQVQVQPNVLAQQPMEGQQYYQYMPINQGMKNTIAKTSLSKRGLWGIIGAVLFLISIFFEVLIITFHNTKYASFGEAFRFAFQKHYIVMLCVAFVALLLVIFSCSKTVLLAALYYVYYYIDFMVGYIRVLERYGSDMLIKLIPTTFLALMGLTFLIMNVFLDKRKQLI